MRGTKIVTENNKAMDILYTSLNVCMQIVNLLS